MDIDKLADEARDIRLAHADEAAREERSRILVSQCADRNFPELCRKLQQWVLSEEPCQFEARCDICGELRLGNSICQPCARWASKVVYDVVQAVPSDLLQRIRGSSTGAIFWR